MAKSEKKKKKKAKKKLQPIKGSSAKKNSITLHRQAGTNAYWVSWKENSKVIKKEITKKVWKKWKDKNKKEHEGLKATTTTYNKAIAGWVIRFYYRVSTKKGDNTWFLDNSITTGRKTLNTSSQLWTPPDNAIGLKVTVKAVSKSF